MEKTVLYIHGQGGDPEEAQHYRPLFNDCSVVGLDYAAQTPWEAKEEFPKLFDSACGQSESVTLIANSIGAYFAMCALSGLKIEKAFFISPIVDMEAMIRDMMAWGEVTDEELHEKGVIKTCFGQTLSWEYLSYVREHPLDWHIPTHILYGKNDAFTSFSSISEFAKKVGATLTVLGNGEHWFHTAPQMRFLDGWLTSLI